MGVASDRLAVLIDAALSSLTAGTNLWSDWFADEPSAAVGIFENPGSGQNYALEGPPAAGNVRIQVKTRGAPHDVAGARTLAWAVHRTLWDMLDVEPATPTDPKILVVLSSHDPVLVERDDRERPIFVCNYDVTAVASAS